MRSPQRIELLSGLAAGVLGLCALGFVLFGPLYSTASGACTGGPNGSTCTPTTYGTATFFEVNHPVQPITIFYLSFLAGLLVGIALLATWHSRTGGMIRRTSLWVLTGFLALSACLGMASVGLFFLPSLALAVIASGAAAGWKREGVSNGANAG